MSDETVDSDYIRRVGERLRRVRRQKHLSLQAVESGSSDEFKASVLGAYERGERAISVPRLQRLAQFYSVPVDQLLPQDQSSTEEFATAAAADPPAGAKVVIDLRVLNDTSLPEAAVLRRFVSHIQVRRQDFNGKVLTVRSSDLELLAAFLDSTVDQVRRRLHEAGVLR